MAKRDKMELFRRGLIYLKNNSTKNILIVLIVMLFSFSILIGISIINSLNSTKTEYNNSLNTGFSVIRDSLASDDSTQYYYDSNGDGLPEYMGPMLWFSDAENIMNFDDRIVRYNVRDYIDLIYSNLNLYPGSFTYFVKNVNEIEKEYGDMSHEEYLELAKEDEIWSHITWFHPEVESELDRLFRIGAFELVKGRHIHKGDKNVALLSEYVAKANGLDIGDTFVPEQKEFLYGGEDRDAVIGEPFSLKIIGIYKINFFQEPSENTPEIEIADNYIFTDFESEKIWKRERRVFKNEDRCRDRFDLDIIDFFLDDPEHTDEVINSLEQSDILDWRFYHIEKNSDDYDSAIRPLTNVTNTVLLFVILVLTGCAAVIFLINSIFAKSRRKETKIYRSLGISSKDIVFQRMFEMIVLSMFAFIIAIIIGKCLAAPIGKYISETVNEKTAQAEEYEVANDANSGLLIVDKSIKTDLNLENQIGLEAIVITFAITEGTVLLAVLISSKGNKDVLFLE